MAQIFPAALSPCGRRVFIAGYRFPSGRTFERASVFRAKKGEYIMKTTKKKSFGVIALCVLLVAAMALMTACSAAPTGQELSPSDDAGSSVHVDEAAPAATVDGALTATAQAATPYATADGTLTDATQVPAPEDADDVYTSETDAGQTVSQSLGAAGEVERTGSTGDNSRPEPTQAPTVEPTEEASAEPTQEPTTEPSHTPGEPSHTPGKPTHTPTPTPKPTKTPGKSTPTPTPTKTPDRHTPTPTPVKTPVDPQPCEHVWGEWIITKPSTCQELGSKYRVCEKCGKAVQTAFADDTAPNYHNYTHVVVDATCTKAGTEYDICTYCGAKKNVYTIHALGHNMQQHVTSKGNCRTPTYGYDLCTRCGYHTPERVLGYGSHQYVETVVQPTCSSTGYTLHKCSVCNNSYKDNYTAKRDHTWGITKAATCTEAGSHTCTVCGATEITEAAKGHSWYVSEHKDATCVAQGHTTHTCRSCGITHTDYTPINPHGHHWVLKADRSGLEKCSLCGMLYEDYKE